MSAGPPRVGLVVGKSVGNAVVRNRVKRRLRHQVSSLLPLLPPGTSVVLRALPPAAIATSAELAAELRTGLTRCLERTPEMTSPR
jgi:ribonuclease P protein component